MADAHQKATVGNISEWKTQGHPWVDTHLQVTGSWGVPTSKSSSAAIQTLTGNAMTAFGGVDEPKRKPALGRVLVEPPPQPPLVGAMSQNAVLALDLTGTEIQDLQQQQQANANTASNTNDTAFATTTDGPPALHLAHSFPNNNSKLIENVQERYQARLEQYMKESILPPLIALAAMEEATLQLVQQRIVQEDAAEAALARRRRVGTKDSSSSKDKTLTTTPHPPLFYTKPPNHYMTAPSAATPAATATPTVFNIDNTSAARSANAAAATTTDNDGDPTKEYLSSTPSAWLNRIKVGCQQAYTEYHTQQQQEQQLIQLYATQINMLAAANGNSAAADTAAAMMDNTEFGGRRSSSRVARIAQEQWEEQKATLDQRQRQTRSTLAAGSSNANANRSSAGVEVYLKGHRIATFLQKQWETEQKEDNSNSNNDSAIKNSGDDVDNDDNADEEEPDDDDEEEDEVEEDDMDLFNPHLQPTYGDVLKFLRKVRMEDIVESVPYWCQEAHSRTNQRSSKKKQLEDFENDEEEEMDNVLEVSLLPLDSLVLGIPETINEDEAEDEEAEEAEAMEVEPETTKLAAQAPVIMKVEEEVKVAADETKPTDTIVKMEVEPTVKSEEAPVAASATELPKAPASSSAIVPPAVESTTVKTEDTNTNGTTAAVGPVAPKVEAVESAILPPVAATAKDVVKVEIKAEEKPKAPATNDEAAVELMEVEEDAPTEVEEEKVEKIAAAAEESVILQWEVPVSVEKAPPKTHVYKYLQTSDHTTFGRYKFALRRKDEELERLQQEVTEAEAPPDENEMQREFDEQVERKEAERAYQTEKTWNKWRFEGIHGGHTVWPKWQHAVKNWQEERNAKQASTDNPNVAIVPASEAKPSPAQEEADRVKALELVAQQEKEEEAAAGAGSRRATRRKASSSTGTVFYGQSSQLTARQLVELILRLCSEKSTAPTIFQLESIVSEDGTQDPVKRLRTALGKLVWRRNQLARLTPCTTWTDTNLCDIVKHKSLLQIAVEEPVVEAVKKAADGTILPGETTVPDVDVQMGVVEAEKKMLPDNKAEEEALMQYIRNLHQTELQLRKIVLEHLTEIPIPIVATAADERKNSNEGYDSHDFEEQSDINWKTEGHRWIGKHIFRPTQMANTNDLSQCEWFTVKSYVPSVACEGTDEVQNITGSAVKESPLVDRRMRFRAAPFVEEEEEQVDFEDAEYLVLTEAQVQAGMKASQMEQVAIDLEEEEEKISIVEHPFAGSGLSSKITLYPLGDKTDSAVPSHYSVVGHNSNVGDAQTETMHRILVLPIATESDPTPDAVWASLDTSDDTEIRCQLEADLSKKYRIQQSDFHPESQAFAECRNIVAFLEKHNKAEAFLEPVDPIALGIPDYLKVITNPMDVATLADKLEQGHYSNIPPKQTAGRSPVARMLNGPFRADVEIIFDNAMLFNPPKDWIHESASAVKKAVVRKIDQLSQSADLKYRRSGKHLEKQSIYIDEDSDAGYEYESDNDDDDDFGGSRRKRKRSKGRVKPKADDNSTRAMEQGVRLQKTLSETLGLRGPFANFRIDNEAASFTLPPEWGCRRKVPKQKVEEVINNSDDDDDEPKPSTIAGKHEQELSELVELTRTLDETEASSLRRSTRAVVHNETGAKRGKKSKTLDIEYVMLNEFEQEYVRSSEELSRNPDPNTRSDVEYLCERLHDSYYADHYRIISGLLEQSDLKDISGEAEGNKDAPLGSFANGSFPPFLGRMVPVSMAKHGKFSWEIRAPFQIAALRWVIRGLIQSGHLGEVEPLEQEIMSSGVIMTNHVYYTDSTLEPFEVLDTKELARRRRANNEEVASSEDEVELSEYEKARLERVARNAERLKALGLA